MSKVLSFFEQEKVNIIAFVENLYSNGSKVGVYKIVFCDDFSVKNKEDFLKLVIDFYSKIQSAWTIFVTKDRSGFFIYLDKIAICFRKNVESVKVFFEDLLEKGQITGDFVIEAPKNFTSFELNCVSQRFVILFMAGFYELDQVFIGDWVCTTLDHKRLRFSFVG